MRWSEDMLRTKFPAKVREQRRGEGLDPDIRPTHDWLREHGYSGIEGFARRNDMSVTEVLIDICGFEPRGKKPLQIDHPETRRLVEAWLQFEEETSYRWNDGRIRDARTHFRTLAELAYEELGSTNLLRLVRSDPPADVELITKLFSALSTRLESQGAQSNYTRSLARWANYLELLEEIESHKVDDVRGMMGYTYERKSPEHKIKAKQIRKCWRATETLEEKTLLVILTAAGIRRSEPTDLKVSQLRLDRRDPYIIFDDDRKTGAATVPIMAGVEVIEAWLDKLEEMEHWEGEWLFPSKKSRDGSRPSGWVNDTIEQIVTRADVTFPDGSPPTPKSFRSFWYEHFMSARQEWLTKVEMLADEQGVSSSKIIDLHYLQGKGERDHFRKFAESYFAAVFGKEMVHGFEGVIEKREEERDDVVQKAIDDYMDEVKEELQDASQPGEDDSDTEGSSSSVNATTLSATVLAIGSRLGKATQDRLEREWDEFTGEEVEWPTPREAATPVAQMVGSLLLLGIFFASAGLTIDPATAEMTLPSTTSSAGLGLGLVGGIVRVLWIDHCARIEEISFTTWVRRGLHDW